MSIHAGRICEPFFFFFFFFTESPQKNLGYLAGERNVV